MLYLSGPMEELAEKHCIPCEADTIPLKGLILERLNMKLSEGWEVIEEHHLEKAYKFKNFKEALNFTNKVGEIAEQEGHHPDIYLAWGKVKLALWTHKINGLSENDFILAAKIDNLR